MLKSHEFSAMLQSRIRREKLDSIKAATVGIDPKAVVPQPVTYITVSIFSTA
jgi:hypothetical protein